MKNRIDEVARAVLDGYNTNTSIGLLLRLSNVRVCKYVADLVAQGKVYTEVTYQPNGQRGPNRHTPTPRLIADPPLEDERFARPPTGVPQHCDLMAAFYGLRPVI